MINDQPYIAGKDLSRHDRSDWYTETIEVLLNPELLPAETSIKQAEEMVREACKSWTIRSRYTLVYSGHTPHRHVRGSIVINWTTVDELLEWYGKEVNGLCRYHFDGKDSDGKWILNSCELYINGDYRRHPDRFHRGTIMHEFGHAAGIHSHVPKHRTAVMSEYGSRGHWHLTLADMQALDQYNVHDAELHNDYSITCPAVNLPGNTNECFFVRLDYNGGPLYHAWKLVQQAGWDYQQSDNVQLQPRAPWHGKMRERVYFQSILGLEFSGHATMVLQGDNLYLENAVENEVFMDNAPWRSEQ